MKAKPDKDLEKLTEELMKETSLEKPSVDFTSKVMFEVMAAEKAVSNVYTPVISRRSWLVIIGTFFLLVIYLGTSGTSQAVPLFGWTSLSDLNVKMIPNIEQLQLSNISLYALGLLAIMLLVQITFLKRYFDKRLDAFNFE